MGKYLLQVDYTAEGLRGPAKEGAASRVAYVTQFAGSMGGTVEAFHFALGEHDAYVVIDAPDDSIVTAASLAVGSSGVASVTTVKLLSASDVDAGIAKIGDYRPPGA